MKFFRTLFLFVIFFSILHMLIQVGSRPTVNFGLKQILEPTQPVMVLMLIRGQITFYLLNQCKA